MIKAQVVADTVWNGKRITTLQLKMPRFILAQFNTHRMFSRSTASSRAIPTAKLLDMVRTEYVRPVFWGKNQAGMQAKEELEAGNKQLAMNEWQIAALNAANSAENLLKLGVHKQIANRILEPFMWAETIVTATEWDNFFNLRLHEDSQPEIQELARWMAKCLKEVLDNSKPTKSTIHLPYITFEEMEDFVEGLVTTDSDSINTELYKYFVPISAARCARVSYLNHDQSNPVIEKDLATADKLISAGHWSPFEHQARAVQQSQVIVTHAVIDEETNSVRECELDILPPEKVRCRNFIGWEQARIMYDK